MAGAFFAGDPLAVAADRPPTAGAPFHLNYGIHDGQFRQHAGPEFTDQIKFAYEQGFRAIEDNGMMDRPVEQQTRIGETLRQLGMTMGVFVLNFDHWPLSTSLSTIFLLQPKVIIFTLFLPKLFVFMQCKGTFYFLAYF